MSDLSKLPNIGNVLATRLKEAGISTPEQLRKMGVVQAFKKIKHHYHPDACINSLYALQGAVMGIRWHDIPKDIKDEIKQEAGL